MVPKPSHLPQSRAEYVVTKLDDLINWARRVSPLVKLQAPQGSFLLRVTWTLPAVHMFL